MPSKKSSTLLSYDFDQAATLRNKVSIFLLLFYLFASFIFIASYVMTGQFHLILYIVVPFVLPIFYFLVQIQKKRSYRTIVSMLFYFYTIMGVLNLTSSPDYLVDLFFMPMLIGIAFLILKYRHALYLSVYLLSLFGLTAAIVQFYQPFDIIYTNENISSVVIGFITSVCGSIVIYFFFAKNFQQNSEGLGNSLLTSQKINDDNKLLISVISHDFRNSLSKLLLQLDAGKRRCKDKALIQELENIESSVFEIADLLKEVQNVREMLMREDQGGMAELSFNTILRKLEMIFRQQLQHRSIRLQYAGRRDFTLQVYPDIFIHLILANLVSNALRFANSGSDIHFELEQSEGITRLRTTYQASEKHRVNLQAIEKLQDQGNFQFDNSGSSKEQGLGILIVRKFCDIHNIDFALQLSVLPAMADNSSAADSDVLGVSFVLEFK